MPLLWRQRLPIQGEVVGGQWSVVRCPARDPLPAGQRRPTTIKASPPAPQCQGYSHADRRLFHNCFPSAGIRCRATGLAGCPALSAPGSIGRERLLGPARRTYNRLVELSPAATSRWSPCPALFISGLCGPYLGCCTARWRRVLGSGEVFSAASRSASGPGGSQRDPNIV